ncbi:MAG TPA: DUF6531 domain-containing protein, partial [Rhodocyclaceae bacterium]|nr:DUF6531 domain-containing protein [Rhodocyclaceae bacterium]
MVRRAALIHLLTRDQSGPRESTRNALYAEAHALAALKTSLAQYNVSADSKEIIGKRLDEVSKLLGQLLKAKSPRERVNASAQLRSWIAQYWKSASESQASQVPHETGKGFSFEPPKNFPAQPVSNKKPEYLSQSDATGYAMFGGGPMGMAALLLPALPDQQYCGYSAADTQADGINVINNAEIQELAQQLEYSPTKILEWVNNKITFEPYYGARKGALAVLYTQAGGPSDIASLTISLLRASGIPARYVKGRVSFSRSQAKEEDEALSRWLGTKTLVAAAQVLSFGQFTGLGYDGNSGQVQFDHVWVEACLPYAHYRGSRIDAAGSRWIALDPSFRSPSYVGGVKVTDKANPADFDYTAFLAKRTTLLPGEYFEDGIRAKLAANNGQTTIDDLLYAAVPTHVNLDVLPSSLPYDVVSYSNWQNSGTPATATLPAQHMLQLSIDVAAENGTSSGTPLISNTLLSMPEVGMKRISLVFKDVSGSSTVSNWLNNGQPTSNSNAQPPCTANAVPTIRVDGVEKNIGPTSVGFCTANNHLDLKLSIDDIGGGAVQAQVHFKNINASSITNIGAYGHQISDRYIQERANSLIQFVRSNSNVNADINSLDQAEGEFLNIVGAKYYKHVAENIQRVSGLAGSVGWLDPSLGVVTTQQRVDQVFDQPFGVNRMGYLIDMPGLLIALVDRDTAITSLDLGRLVGYSNSSFESYVWQENARQDAVSTVRGLQFANENGIPVYDFDASIQSCADLKSSLIYKVDLPPSVSNSINAETNLCNEFAATENHTDTPEELRACVRGALTILDPSAVSYYDDLPNSSSDPLAYPKSKIDNICSTYFGAGSTAKIKIPRSNINYDGWVGGVFMAENGATFHADISGQSSANGGYSIPTFPQYDYDPSFDSGFQYWTPPPLLPSTDSPSFPSFTPPATISPAIGLGVTPYTMTAGDPVNLVNGNLYHDETDISIKGRGGLPIVFERSYNSREAKDGPLGFGWTHSFNQYIEFADDNPDQATHADDTDSVVSSIVWTDGTGSRKSIASNAAATSFTTPSGFYFTVSRDAQNRYVIQEKNGMKYFFEAKDPSLTAGYRAKLIRIEDRNGNALMLSYDGSSNLISVTDGLNRSLTFSYSGIHITQISDWAGRTWQYGYDTAGDLTHYNNPIAAGGQNPGKSYEYYTADDGQDLAHEMKRYTMPRGNGMTFEYYINGRVFRHYNTQHPDEAMSFSYNDFRRETVVTDERGNVTHDLFTRFGNPERIIAADGGVKTFTYDCANLYDTTNTSCANPYNRLSMTNEVGQTTQYAYDSQGNLTQTTLPSGTTVKRDGFAANTFGQARRVQDQRGNWSINRFDVKGNVIDQIVLKAGIAPTGCPANECDLPAATSISGWTQLA